MDAFAATSRICLAALSVAVLLPAQGANAIETLWTYDVPVGYVDTSPAVGDINNDGEPEIVLATTGGNIVALSKYGEQIWRCDIENEISIPPTLSDATGDGNLEVLAMNNAGLLLCLEGASGNPLWTWRFAGKINWGYTAIVAEDLDGDGAVEVVAGDSLGTVACLTGHGEVLWTYSGSHGATLCPAVGDLDGDGLREVVVGGTKTPLVCLTCEGKKLWSLDQPARGSSPVICDLDGDGRLEIVVGVDAKLAAVSAEGDILWTQDMKREIDSAITVVDADNDGALEIYAIDLTGLLVCVSPSGELLWTADVEERVRRSPSVANVDGDDALEILVAGYSGALHVFTPDGRLKARIADIGKSNSTATIADLLGDGRPCIIFPVDGSHVRAFRWEDAQPAATVLWPEYRLRATRGASLIDESHGPEVRIADIDFGKHYVGSNMFRVSLDNPSERELTVNLGITQNNGARANTELSSSEKLIEHALSYTITGREAVTLDFVCTVLDAEEVVTKRTRTVNVVPFMREVVDSGRAVSELETLLPRLSNTRGIEDRVCYLKSKLPAFRERATMSSGMTGAERVALHKELTDLREQGAALLDLVRAAVDAGAGPIVLSAANPWAPFGGLEELGEGRLEASDLNVEAFQGEIESAAINIFNFGSRSLTLRVEPEPFEPASGETQNAVPAWEVIIAHEVLDVPTQTQDMSADAIPKLNQARTIRIAPWDARQLWLNVDTKRLTPGVWNGRICLRSLDVNPIEATAKLTVTVWEAKLPEESPLRLCHWGYVHRSILEDQADAALDDQVSHGTNVFVATIYPRAEFDENGALVGEIDFSEHDAYVKRHAPHGIILFCGYQGSLRGPGGHDSPAYKKAHLAWLRAWVGHLAELGVGYDGFALYPIDEPGLREGLVERYIEYGKLAREADPKILMYTDPVNTDNERRITMEELERMAPYVDIWCPNRGGFLLEERRDLFDNKGAQMLAFMKSTGSTVWTYECSDHAKHQSPLGYYRAQAWLVWHHGLTGIGFWSYCTSSADPWYRPASTNDYLLIYQGDGVVASKRWEAIRDGIEDYAMLVELRQAADTAEARGNAEQAVREARRLLGESASAIARFCGRDRYCTLPGEDGLPGVRRLADERWREMQSARREIARLLSILSQD